MNKEEATPLEWLEWFWQHCDFGPADYDVKDMYERNFKRVTGKNVPKEYSIHCDDEYEEC